MTYNVFSGSLNPTQSQSQSAIISCLVLLSICSAHLTQSSCCIVEYQWTLMLVWSTSSCSSLRSWLMHTKKLADLWSVLLLIAVIFRLILCEICAQTVFKELLWLAYFFTQDGQVGNKWRKDVFRVMLIYGHFLESFLAEYQQIYSARPLLRIDIQCLFCSDQDPPQHFDIYHPTCTIQYNTKIYNAHT